MIPILRIPWLETGIQPFVEKIGKASIWEGIETTGELLDSESGWEDLLDSFDLPLMALCDLLPADVSRYLAEAGALAREALVRHIAVLLERAAAAGVTYVSIDLGVEREVGGTPEELLAIRAAMLRELMPLAERLDIIICIPLRVPAVPASSSSFNAVRLVKQVMHRSCQLVLEVYPEELDADHEPGDVLANLHAHVGVIRWHYEPYLGFHLRSRFVNAWRNILIFHGYTGLVVSCPHLRDAETLGDELPRLARFWQ